MAEAVTAGKERGSRGPVEGTPQRQGAGVVSPGGGDTQNGGRAFDPRGGAVVKGGAALSNGLGRPFNALLELLAQLIPQLGM